MKRRMAAISLAVALVSALGFLSSVYAVPAVPQLLDRVDIGDPASEATHDVSQGDWGIIIAPPPDGSWGGLGNEDPPGTARVVWETFDDPTPRYATLTLNTAGSFARHIKMRVMEGYANDSFNVYVKNPAGKWALVYSYITAPSTTETWIVHDIHDFPAGKGKSTAIEIKIEATGTDTWPTGRLAVDWVEAWDH